MKKKLMLWNTVIVALALVLMLGLGIFVTRSDRYEMTEEKIREITAIYVATFDPTDLRFASEDDIRVTVLDAAGRVLADSDAVDPAEMENHKDREEIVAAFKGTPMTVTRTSETTGRKMMYYAECTEVGGDFYYIRVAIPVASVSSYVVKSSVPMLFIMLVVLFLTTLCCYFFGAGLLKPLETVRRGLAGVEKGTYREIPPMTDDEEINRMLVDINAISTKLQTSVTEARSEREKLDYVLNHVSDGIVVTDTKLSVVIVNRCAESIFGITGAVGKGIRALTADETFIGAMADAAESGRGSIFRVGYNGAWYLVTVHKTENGLVIAVLTDVTAEKNGEQMRLEFFANASHELKTPLTTIKGFNDLIAMEGQDERTRGYAERIDREVARMLSLIDDMLNLSRLESTTLTAAELTPLSLDEIAGEVAESLQMLASEKKITVSVTGDATLACTHDHAYELIKNLTENAIRYGREGGHAYVSLETVGGAPVLTVKDDGIGIDAEHQSRIFERFYRVDKSRSRATGGTGLGLAIVKHICDLYGAEIALTSKRGVGTTVRVTFPAGDQPHA